MKKPVPDLTGPSVELCWAQNTKPPNAMVRCDRAKGHLGPHSWEFTIIFSKIREQLRMIKTGYTTK